jgi:hypothetical protein
LPESPLNSRPHAINAIAENETETAPPAAAASPPEKEGLVSSITRLFGGSSQRRGADFELRKQAV